MKSQHTLALPALLAAIFLGGCAIEPGDSFEVAEQTRALTDLDRDGVIDARDGCTATPGGASISNNGCENATAEKRKASRVIMFGYDEDTLSSAERSEWIALMQKLAGKDGAELVLIGDTSPEGSEAYNQALAQRRSDFIRAMAKEAGLTDSQIKTEVYFEKNQIPNELSGRDHRLIAVARWQETGVEMDWNIFSSDKAPKVKR
ncbi:OmpA family protein [Shewanella sp. JM162201]|uniref:OmpA family protein n=1 Tax=Shewanella jiangmenensis TaxID=2837387 RepID=A0ABS5V984_9GAMM|nr:OmpA family protein [Shewanella jiangmenensis]MBT1446432.1 OmpA family protein [Shewanella jiangmenensis]